jgi:hypothetical protein
VPSSFYNETSNDSRAPISGVLQPYVKSDSVIDVTNNDIFKGILEVPFKAILEAVIIELQFGIDDAISENLFLDLKNKTVLHFDDEHDLPMSNNLTKELSEDGQFIDATPPFRSCLIAHPDAFRALEKDEKELIRNIVHKLSYLTENVEQYFELRKDFFDQIPDYNRSQVLLAWKERTEWMSTALENFDEDQDFSLVDFVMMSHPVFQYVAFYRLAADLIESMNECSFDGLDQDEANNAYSNLVRSSVGEITNHSNYLPDLKTVIEDFENETGKELTNFIEENLAESLEVFSQKIWNFIFE